MKIFGLCLIALSAAVPAGAAPAAAAEGGAGAAPPGAPAQAQSLSAAPTASSRFIYGTPGETYPYYAGLPQELWPYRNIEPYERFFLTRMPFRGPGRDYPPPPGLESLKIGLLDSPRYGPNWDRSVRTHEGIVLAVEEANRARQPGQLPFELVEREGVAQWGGAANLAAEFADQGVLGFLGTVDGAEAHVALRVTLKTEVVMINTSDPDPTLTETNIPWLIRVLPDHRLEEARLADLIVHRLGCHRIAILRAGDRFGRLGVTKFMDFARRLGCPAVQELLFTPGNTDIPHQLAAIKDAQPDAIFFVGEPDDIGRFALQFRREGIQARYFGTDHLMDERFLQNAGDAADGTMITCFFDPGRRDPLWVDFVAHFRARWGHEPDAYSAYAYDGAQILIHAIQKAGPNRWRIRDQVCNLDYYQGVTGWMRFDGTGTNIAPVRLVRFDHGRRVFEPEPEFSPAVAQSL
ncbi:MAG TPA: ABC transporter substrate-binding protein [Opitutaceae bacterium]|nr:ABC transporter substrate-binding protein [Opitutaceae bacterium]